MDFFILLIIFNGQIFLKREVENRPKYIFNVVQHPNCFIILNQQLFLIEGLKCLWFNLTHFDPALKQHLQGFNSNMRWSVTQIAFLPPLFVMVLKLFDFYIYHCHSMQILVVNLLFLYRLYLNGKGNGQMNLKGSLLKLWNQVKRIGWSWKNLKEECFNFRNLWIGIIGVKEYFSS